MDSRQVRELPSCSIISPLFWKSPKGSSTSKEIMDLCFSDSNPPTCYSKVYATASWVCTNQPTALHWQLGVCWNPPMKVPFTAGTLNMVHKLAPYRNWQAIKQMKNILMFLFSMQHKSSHISSHKKAEGRDPIA